MEWLCAVSVNSRGDMSYFKIKRVDLPGKDDAQVLFASSQPDRDARNFGKWTRIAGKEYHELTGHIALFDFDRDYQ